jgi:polysaccharide biosynthesis/export protein
MSLRAPGGAGAAAWPGRRLRVSRIAVLTLAALSVAGQRPDRPATAAYVLGPDDQIAVHAPDAEEIGNAPIRIDTGGYIRLPLAGRIKAAGLTAEQLENEIAARLKVYIKQPDVAVSVHEFRSQPVSVIGSVKNPGVHQLQGRKTLVEILSLAGGLADDAGHSVKITRRLEWGRVPLREARDDESGGFSVGEVNLDSIMRARKPEENIVILPRDVISVPRADMVYVVGQVMKAGGFVLRERETLSALQALSLAGGTDRAAAPQNARILRPVAGAESRAEIAVDLKRILAGQAADVALESEDILFVPGSTPKRALARAAEAAIQLTTGLIIFRR